MYHDTDRTCVYIICAVEPLFRAHQSVKTWFLNLVVTRNVFSKCPRHCAFVSVSNAHARD